MNNGAFGENFPYSNFHDLNMDWIVKIAKDFLDQYTHIQETIQQGLTDIDEETQAGITSLQDKANALETLLNEWYTLHKNYLDETLQTNTQAFNTLADQKTAQSIASIPSDYTALANNVASLIEVIESEITVTGYGIQLVNPLDSNYHAEKRWNASGGLSNAGANYVAVMIPVTPGERYCANFYPSFTFTRNSTTGTVTQVPLNYYADYYETDIGEIIIPNGADQLLATLANTNLSAPILFKEKSQYFYKPDNFHVAYGKPIINYPGFDSLFKGQKYYSFGDSITSYDKSRYTENTSVAGSMCQGYQHYIQALLGFDSYNKGVSGADSNGILSKVLATDVSDARLVTIMTGVNDFGRSIPVATFKDNLRQMIHKIQTDNPRCTLVLLSNTFGHFDTIGYIDRTYADAMKEIAEEAQIPFIDNMQNNGFNMNNLSAFMADLPVTTYSIHPNCDGFAVIGKQIANRIADLMK